MTIYVDSANIQADVFNKETGRVVSSSWSHLITDQLDPEELHEFATTKLGLRRSYFQTRSNDTSGEHYDLTSGKAKQAVRHGAVLLRPEDLASITVLKRTAMSLEGCVYALSSYKDKWLVAVEWGSEAEDSPMCGAAAYGMGDNIWDAVRMAVAEIKGENE